MKEFKPTPLTNEHLSHEEVYELVKLNKQSSMSIHQGYFMSLDRELHDGYIVMVVNYPVTNAEDITYYFMETSEELSHMSLKGGKVYNIYYHKLIPIHVGENDISDSDHIKEISKFIINGGYDKFGFYKDNNGNLIPLNSPMFRSNQSLSMNEKRKLEAIRDIEQKEIIKRFEKDDLPEPEHPIWYKCLADIDSRGTGDYEFENKIIEILKNNNHKVSIDGEKDSFGWVTRGLIVDGKWMCLM